MGEGFPEDGDAIREVLAKIRLGPREGLGRRLERLAKFAPFGGENRLLEELGGLGEVRPVLLAQRKDELDLLDGDHDVLPLRLLELLLGRRDLPFHAVEIVVLVGDAGRLRDAPCGLRRHPEGLRFREGPMELLQALLDAAEAAYDRLDALVGLLGPVEGVPEGTALEGLPRVVQEGDGFLEVHAQVHRGDELVPGGRNRLHDPLELGVLEGLEALLCPQGGLPVVGLADRRLGACEVLLRGGRVGAEGLRLLNELREVRDASFKAALKGLLALRAALAQGVVCLLEIEVRHIRAGPLEEGGRLRHVGAKFLGRPHEVLRVPDFLLGRGHEVVRNRLEAFLREVECRLEVPTLHRGAGAG